METEDRSALEDWVAALTGALDLGDTGLDIDQALELAGVAARTVVRPAAPLTTYLVGVAVGRAIASGAQPGDAYASAAAEVERLASVR